VRRLRRMLLSNTSVGNMTIPSGKIVINTRHTTSERRLGFCSTHLLNALHLGWVPMRGRAPKPSRTLVKSLMECSSSVIFMTSKNDLHQRDETLFAKKFRRAEIASLKDPQTIISEVGSCYRSTSGREIAPVAESVRRGSGGSTIHCKIAEGALIPRHCRSR
jgi:hypothetical protein